MSFIGGKAAVDDIAESKVHHVGAAIRFILCRSVYANFTG